MAVRCPQCGRSSSGESICTSCGALVGASTVAPATATVAQRATAEAREHAVATEGLGGGVFVASGLGGAVAPPIRDMAPASFLPRAAATVIDASVSFALALGVVALLEARGVGETTAEAWLIPAWIVGYVLAAPGVAGISDGRSLGKWIGGMKVVREGGRPMGFGGSFLRDIVLRLIYVIPFVWLADLLMPLGGSRRSLRDRMIRSRVVRTEGYERRGIALTGAIVLFTVAWVAILSAVH